MAATTAEISRMFSSHRFTQGKKIVLCVLYFPFGLLLAILRVFLGLHIFIVSCVLPKPSLVRRLILRFMCLLLGIVVSHKGFADRDRSARVMIANHVSVLDHIALDFVTPIVTPNVWRLSSFLMWAMGYVDFGAHAGREALIQTAKEHCSKSSQPPVLTFPEGAMTNGQVGLLKYSTWSFSIQPVVQPVVIKVSRPIPVSVETIGGSLVTDVLWFLFVPFSVFYCRFLPSQKRKEGESEEEFAKRVQELMAKELSIEATPFTNADKSEYVKRYLHRPPQIQVPSESPPSRSVPPTPPPSPTTPTENATNNHLLELEKMVRQVQEVLPHIGESTIRKDLRSTSCVDTTITNILEERVEIVDSESTSPGPSSSSSAAQTPTEPEGATAAVPQSSQSPTAIKFCSPTFGKSSSTRQMSYQERKAALLESARRHYMEKHGMI